VGRAESGRRGRDVREALGLRGSEVDAGARRLGGERRVAGGGVERREDVLLVIGTRGRTVVAVERLGGMQHAQRHRDDEEERDPGPGEPASGRTRCDRSHTGRDLTPAVNRTP
jgi:hypothetical protein